MKYSILFSGILKDNHFEGLIKIVNVLNLHISDKYKISRNSKKISYNLINIHSGGFLEALKYKKNKIPTIYSLHSNFGSNFFNELKDQYDLNKYLLDNKYSYNKEYGNVFKKLILRLISISTPIFIKRHFFRKFDLVIVANNYMKKIINLKNVIVIKHGIDFNKFKPLKKNTLPNKLKIAYFGHLASNKGVLEVVRAFANIENSTCEKYVYTTTQSNKFKSYVHKLDSRIVLGGYIKDIVKEYNSCDLIVLPFRNETAAIATPLVLIEAMACNIPIITTDLPHIREYCGNNVFYISPRNEKELIIAINNFIKNPSLMEKYSKNGRNQIIKNHNINKMIKEYEKVYDKLLIKNGFK